MMTISPPPSCPQTYLGLGQVGQVGPVQFNLYGKSLALKQAG